MQILISKGKIERDTGTFAARLNSKHFKKKIDDVGGISLTVFSRMTRLILVLIMPGSLVG